MYRTKKVVVRLSAMEHCAVSSLARAEKLPAATMARRLLLQEAEQRGLLHVQHSTANTKEALRT